MPCHEGGEESGERTDVEKQGSGGGNELSIFIKCERLKSNIAL